MLTTGVHKILWVMRVLCVSLRCSNRYLHNRSVKIDKHVSLCVWEWFWIVWTKHIWFRVCRAWCRHHWRLYYIAPHPATYAFIGYCCNFVEYKCWHFDPYRYPGRHFVHFVLYPLFSEIHFVSTLGLRTFGDCLLWLRLLTSTKTPCDTRNDHNLFLNMETSFLPFTFFLLWNIFRLCAVVTLSASNEIDFFYLRTQSLRTFVLCALINFVTLLAVISVAVKIYWIFQFDPVHTNVMFISKHTIPYRRDKCGDFDFA